MIVGLAMMALASSIASPLFLVCSQFQRVSLVSAQATGNKKA